MLPASAYEGLGLAEQTVKILTRPQPAPAAAASPNVLQAEPQSARDLAPNSSSITLYAELLLHIRTVTLFASLRTAHTRETKAQLSTDGYSITVSHEGETASIRLPIKAKGGGDAALSLPANPPSKEISLRLQIEEQDDSDLFGDLYAEERKANLVPWDGLSLNEAKDLQILCKSCNNTLLVTGKVHEWRNLPNENWAEMMDFWHCHKPDEHHLHDRTHHTTVAEKGYAAGNRLKAVQGKGFVDLASLMLKQQDCEGIRVGRCFSRPSTPHS
jgi:ubiquitin-protein ligase E3 D